MAQGDVGAAVHRTTLSDMVTLPGGGKSSENSEHGETEQCCLVENSRRTEK